MKLRQLWSDNKYFSKEIEDRFNSHIVEYKQVSRFLSLQCLVNFVYNQTLENNFLHPIIVSSTEKKAVLLIG